LATVHQARSSVISLLYAFDFGNDDMETLKKEMWDEQKIRNRQREFANSLLSGIIENLDFIDKTILEHLRDRDLEDIGKVEKAVLRVGVYEIKFRDTDKAIVINEALELIRDFGIESATKLINGVLDSIEVKKAEK
jgi:N utilization substance protein B